MAEDLEKATGICREAWLYPHRHWNPYIPFNGLSSCVNCLNKANRIGKGIEVATAHFRKHKDFKVLAEIAVTYTGQKGIGFVFRELTGENMRVLGYAGDLPFTPQDVWTKEQSPERYKLSSTDSSLIVPHVPYGLTEAQKAEMEVFVGMQLKSFFMITRGGISFLLLSFEHPVSWQDETIKGLESFIQEIADIYHGTDN